MNNDDKKTYYMILASLLSALLILVAIEPSSAENKQLIIAQTDPLVKIFKETKIINKFNDTIEVVRGENAVFQISIRSNNILKNIHIHLSQFTNNKTRLDTVPTIGYIGYVHNLTTATKKGSDTESPNSGIYPDPIIENTTISNIKANNTVSYWISLPIPIKAIAGNYTAIATIEGICEGKTFKRNIKLNLKIYPISLEEPTLWVSNWSNTPSTKSSFNGNWINVNYISKEWWKIQKNTAIKLHEMHNNVVYLLLLEYINFKQNGSKYIFDFSLLDKLIKVYKEAGAMKMLEGAPIATRSHGGWYDPFVWMVPYYKDGQKKFSYEAANSSRAKRFYGQFLPQLCKHLKETFPDLTYVQHIADEPIDENSPSYITIAKTVKGICPKIKTIEAIYTTKVSDYLDIEVPQLEFLGNNYLYFEQMQRKGHQVWLYTCCLPQGNYANHFIEQPTLKIRFLPWIAYKYGITGILHWAFNRWSDNNPYEEAGDNQLPGGDSWITYPSESGKLYSSLRFEALRDGIADYALLYMLSKRDKEKSKALASEIVKGWSEYDTNPTHFRKVRHNVLISLSTNK